MLKFAQKIIFRDPLEDNGDIKSIAYDAEAERISRNEMEVLVIIGEINGLMFAVDENMTQEEAGGFSSTFTKNLSGGYSVTINNYKYIVEILFDMYIGVTIKPA